jgi:hypothetical protein
MWLRFALFSIAAMVVGFVKTGDLSLTTKVIAWLSPIFLLASYFSSRKGVVATRGEQLTAYAWLTLRRLLCFTGAALFFAAAVTTLVIGPLDMARLLGAIAIGGLSVFLIWFGIYGEERHSHRKRMARYDLGETKKAHKD